MYTIFNTDHGSAQEYLKHNSALSRGYICNIRSGNLPVSCQVSTVLALNLFFTQPGRNIPLLCSPEIFCFCFSVSHDLL